MIVFLSIVVGIAIAGYLFFRQTKFGKLPSGARLVRVQSSPNFREGTFKNKNHTPDLTEGVTYWEVMKEFFFKKNPRKIPNNEIPNVKTDLLKLDLTKDVFIWFGHSSYFLQIDGKKILVDPVFSGSASPLPIGVKAFKGSNNYSADDLPEIDYLFISHDHWDHLDYETIKKIRTKVNKVICGLGVGEHFEYWGYEKEKVIEKDWDEEIELEAGFVVNTVSARHFSGRGLKRNTSLWLSFVLKTPTMKLFIGGDSGYDNHFSEIGNRFGEFDLAILENGQYDRKWRYIHMLPTEILNAAKELKAKRIIPVHSSKFVLGNHDWDEPLELIYQNGIKENVSILTPMIGEEVNLKKLDKVFMPWWRTVK